VHKPLNVVRIYLALLCLGGVVALLTLFAIPSEQYASGLFGYSRNRLLLTASMAAIEISLLVFILVLSHKPSVWENRLNSSVTRLKNHSIFYGSLSGALGIFILGGDYLYALAYTWDQTAFPLLVRIAPLVGWTTWNAGVTIIMFTTVKRNIHHEDTKTQRKVVSSSLRTARTLQGIVVKTSQHLEEVFSAKFGFSLLIAWITLAGLAVVIQATGMGLIPDIVGWDFPGTPLLFSQIILALIAGNVVYIVATRTTKISDRLIFFVIWAAALGVWAAQPMQPTHYSLEPNAPNFMYTPYSDAALLMMNAEDMLIGEGFQFPAEKPLYNVLLGLLTALGGHDYNTIILLQVGTLAFFPAVVYLFSVGMDQRLAGLVAAVALILREQNAIALSSRINVSHSKLIMTDFPAALGMAVFGLLFVKWWNTHVTNAVNDTNKNKKNSRHLPIRDIRVPSDASAIASAMITGSALGALILIRSQAIIFVPVVFGVVVFQFWGQSRKILLPLGAFLLGTAVFILPWMVRNGFVVGKFGYSQPMQAVYLDSQYTREPGVFDLAQAAPNERIEQGFGNAADFARANPGYVAQFISNHFFHNEVTALLSLPMRFDLTDYWLSRLRYIPSGEASHRRAYIENLPFWSFQERWQGNWPPGAVIPIIFNLAILGMGIAAAWRRTRWIGLMPLGIHLAYSFSTAIARVSGSRFMLPVDWIIIWYYIIGLVVLVRALFGIRKIPVKQTPTPGCARASQLMRPLPLLGSIALLGALIPILEFLPPTRYPERTTEAVTAVLPIELEEICGLDEGVTVIQGRALYPRFYAANQGYGWGVWAAYNHYPYARIGFLVAGPENVNVILPLEEAPAAFPHAEDVFVIGTQAEGHLLAQAVVVQNQDGSQQTILSNQVHWCTK
jgi:hypothetical protein